MAATITAKDLRIAFEFCQETAIAAGVTEASRWHLEIGSKTYGRAFRIWLAHEDFAAGMAVRTAGGTPAEWHTGHYTPAVRDYLGMTKAEAFATLHSYSSAFRAVTAN